MPILQLEPFEIDEVTLGLIDKLRDGMSREQYFRRLIQGGLANALEELARISRDFVTAEIHHQTSHQLAGRKLLTLDKARASVKPVPRLVESPPHDDAAPH